METEPNVTNETGINSDFVGVSVGVAIATVVTITTCHFHHYSLA